jgi:acyl transferase domain-containing protein/3-hydroxymyristoyl/3-hydroxydecanoyl-(acyl carrier protein) dehydratase
MSRIAIVGLGGLFPSAPTPRHLWENVLAGVDAAREPPPGRWLLSPDEVYDPVVARPDRIYSRKACFLDPFTLDPTGLDVDPDVLAGLDVVFHLALHAGRQAWHSAVTATLDRRRVGVILGSIALPTEKASALARHCLGPTFFAKRGVGCPVTPDPVPHPLNAQVTGLPAGLLARALGLGGICYTIDAACASSLYAIKLAIDELTSGRADAMLAGGLSRPDSLYTQMGFAQLRALSPSGRCSPFDVRGDGLVVGEGAGTFLLKRLEDAVHDGDRILGVIAGVGLSNDVGGGLLAPASEGQLRALHTAYEQTGWRPEDLDLIECHATGTPVGDAVELRSLKALWQGVRHRPGQCVIGSVKSTTGHLLTGAGAAALTKVLFALNEGILPPTANFEQAPPGLELDGSPFRVLDQPEPWHRREGKPRRAAVSAFGFGGINAHLLIEEWNEKSTTSFSRDAIAERGAGALRSEDSASRLNGTSAGAPAIAIVSLAANFASAPSLDAMRRQLYGEAPPAPRPPRCWWGHPDANSFPGHYLDEIVVAAERFRIPPREIEEMLPQQALVLQVAGDALSEARLDSDTWPRTGVFVGLGLDLNTTNFHFRWSVIKHDPAVADRAGSFLNANRTMGALASIAASRIAREFRFGGPSFTVSSGETSGLHALQIAADAVRRGELDQAIVAAVDLTGDPRAVLARTQLSGTFLPGDAAIALVLKRLDDAIRDGDHIHSVLRPDETSEGIPVFGAETSVGHAGAAAGLASLARACLALREQVLPADCHSGLPRPWLRDLETGPRRAVVEARTSAGQAVRVLLEQWEDAATVNAPPAPVPVSESLFVVEGVAVEELIAKLRELRTHLASSGDYIHTSARAWRQCSGMARTGNAGRAVAMVARDRAEALRLIDSATYHLERQPEDALVGRTGTQERDRLFYSPRPLGTGGEIAFVYPGSGNDFPGMGREIALCWPGVLRRQDTENRRLASQYLPEKFWTDPPAPASVKERIFAQVALGSLVSDVLASFGVHPTAAIGYSLGESSALFSLRAWPDRDRMLEAMNESTLFVSDLTGECNSARATWGLPPGAVVDWQTGIVDRSPMEVRVAKDGLRRVYLQVVNTPRECVIGGERSAVAELVRRLDTTLVPVPETTTMHCEVVDVVADAYRTLHRLPTIPLPGIRFYSTGLRRAYDISPDATADAILRQAERTVDFPAVIEAAYHDGVRLFVEVGPGASCSRMIGAILGDRPHRVRSACAPGADGLSALWRTLAMLISERVPVDLAAVLGERATPATAPPSRPVVVPVGGEAFEVSAICEAKTSEQGVRNRTDETDGTDDPYPSHPSHPSHDQVTALRLNELVRGQIGATAAVQDARAQAHAAFFRFDGVLQRTFTDTLAFQGQLFEELIQARRAWGVSDRTSVVPPGANVPGSPGIALDRAQCLEFAIGSIAHVLGPDFTEIDSYPTRVRLPDEPLMLVDRILAIEGEPRSLTRGRVVTEHDIHPNAWYLDCGRIPTCIAVEAGQADLFLSGYLGIDFRTRGLAVYRLLDAAVTFHRGLPGPGAVIRYDIHIDRFFQQGETYLFRFRFVGTVDGEPLLTMTEGCAGFFSEKELAAGKGVVHTALQQRKVAGIEQDEASILPSIQTESYDEQRVDALRRGDLATCFGPAFADLPLRDPMRLPGGKMRLVHRVTRLDPRGGRFGIGQIRAEADIHPDDWFLTCHFVDDQVMPGTLMYECCLHTLRIFLLRLGWVGERSEVVCEPVPGVVSRLKCRGQVTATTRTVTYEVTLKERGYRPAPYAIVDALMYADGKPIVDITDMSIRLSGLTREGVARVWSFVKPSPLTPGPSRPRGQGRTSPFTPDPSPARGEGSKRAAVFDRDRILAFAVGKPSEAFGEPYRVFDQGRVIARLPGPPFSFLDRIVAIDAEPWNMIAGGVTVAEYDVPPDEWYFASERTPIMPFAVLLEAALQPCGWLAAYVGSALTSPTDLCFRNLGGNAELLRPVTRQSGMLTTKVHITRVSSSAGMIIQDFDFHVHDDAGPVYRGSTTFGFFSAAALAQQVGLRDVRLYEPQANERLHGRSFDYPRHAPYPDEMLGMMDRVELLLPEGGPAGLGYVRGHKTVRPPEWFFKAHFYQDPVWPGSLGLEALLQLLKVAAVERWHLGHETHFEANVGGKHQWTYRGQVVPSNREVIVEVIVTRCDDKKQELSADGVLYVDSLAIYRMNDFTLRAVERFWIE